MVEFRASRAVGTVHQCECTLHASRCSPLVDIRTQWHPLSADIVNPASSGPVDGAHSIDSARRRRAEVLRRRPTSDSGSWHRSPYRPQHESDGIQVSYATLPAALTSVTDLCRARPARWPDHLLVITQRSFASSACAKVNIIAERAVLHQICVRYIAICPG